MPGALVLPFPIRGEGGGKQSAPPASRAAQEAPNTLQSKNTARIVDVISEGEIVGLVDGEKSIFFNDTALKNPDGTYNFQGVTIETKEGTPGQGALSGFPEVETEVDVGVKVTETGGPIVRTVTESNVNAVRIKIRTPQLTTTNTKTGDLTGASVQFKIEIQPNGGSYALATLKNETNPITLAGKCTSAYEVGYRVELPGLAPWNIRVTRITEDADVVTLQNEIYWSSFTKIIDAKLAYPDTALVGVSVDASLFGLNIPTRAYEIDGIIIQVPSNYDPETREYTGIWDGTFQNAWSDNPAWVLFDILTNERYGLGNFIQQTQVDKFALYAIGQYCDELVPDGKGGTEPRFTFNGVFQTRQEAYQVINAITSCFRGMSYWGVGAVSVTCDKPEDPVKLVTPANVIDGFFEYSGTALKARHTAALVTWNDPDDGYKANIAVTEDPVAIQMYGWRQLDTVAFGCTKAGQAKRFGKWALDSEQNETEMVTYRASYDHANVRPGQIISIADPDYAGVRFGGRNLGATDTEITLDKPVTLNSGQTYQLSCVLPDGSVETQNVTNTLGATYSVLTTDAFSDTPMKGAIWVLTSTSLEPRRFRVISVRETEVNIWEIQALFHDPTKYDRVEQDIKVDPPNYALLPVGALQAPTALGFSEYQYKSGVSVKTALTVSWIATTDPRCDSYQVYAKGPLDADFKFINSTTGTSFDILDIQQGTYEVQVRAVSGLYRIRSAYLSGSFDAAGLSLPPADVTNFTIAVTGDNTYLSWNQVADLDLNYYVIKYTPDLVGAEWGTSQILVNRIPPTATIWPVPSLVGTYLIKAVDVLGNESINATLVVTNIAALLNYNAVDEITEETAWTGTKVNVTKDGSLIELTDVETIDDWSSINTALTGNPDNVITGSGIYYFANSGGATGAACDLGQVFTSRLTAMLSAFGVNGTNTVDSWLDVDAITNWDGDETGKFSIMLQVRYTSDDPAGTPTWSEWGDFIIGDYTARAFQFRLLMASFDVNINPTVTNATVKVDMPDRVAGDRNITSDAAGSPITFSPAFNAIPAINITGNNLQQGDYWTVTSASETGFTIRFFNSAGTGVARNFDWMAKGYGYVG